MSDVFTFTEPTRTWVSVTNAEIASGTLAGPVLRALVNDSEFIRESIIGDNTTVTSVPHVHDGADTPQIEVGTWTRNLITNSAPDAKKEGDWSGAGDWWPRTKYKRKKPPHVHVAEDVGFIFSGRKNAHVWTIPTTRADLSQMIWGGGADLTLAVFAKRVGTLTEGELSFGLSTGSGWVEGCRFAIDYTDLTTTHKRFYGFCTVSPELTEAGVAVGPDSDTEQLNGPRFELRMTENADGPVITTCFQLSLGHRLRWWMPARMDAHGNGSTHDDWLHYSAGCPAWATSIAMTNAVRLYGV